MTVGSALVYVSIAEVTVVSFCSLVFAVVAIGTRAAI